MVNKYNKNLYLEVCRGHSSENNHHADCQIYTIATTTFTPRQCDLLMQPILKAILPKMGIARTSGRKYLHGQIHLQGSNIPHVYTDLGYERINLLLTHGGQDTQLGKAIECCLEYHQLECGATTQLFDLDYLTYGPLVTNSIMKHTWDFLRYYNLTLTTSHSVPLLLCKNIKVIMPAIAARTQYSKNELCEINLCCLYLQVLTVADIVEGNGNQVTTYAAEGKREPTRISKWKWPTIPYPPLAAWAK